MLGRRTVCGCGACGVVLPIATGSLEQCPGCGAPLHACRQCARFDPARRFACARPIAARIADKAARNDCPGFCPRVTVEHDATLDGPRPGDARKASGDLFRT